MSEYRAFLEFVGRESARERMTLQRWMAGVLFWCFLLPAGVSILILLLVKWGYLPPRAKGLLEWLILVFPIAYSMVYLLSQMARDLPTAYRRGGIWLTLAQAEKESEWRERTIEAMASSLRFPAATWRRISRAYSLDIRSLEHRTRYVTALSGGIFFLILQGIDALVGEEEKTTWVRDSVFGWVEATSGLSQFVGLGFLLVLLYLSGSQTLHSLRRFLDCAEQLAENADGK